MSEPGTDPLERATDPQRVAFFLAFRRCGGAPTLGEWSRLPLEDFQSLSEASAMFEAERAARLVEAFALQAQEASRAATLASAARDLAVRRG